MSVQSSFRVHNAILAVRRAKTDASMLLEPNCARITDAAQFLIFLSALWCECGRDHAQNERLAWLVFGLGLCSQSTEASARGT